jgi:hypothetical protein
VHFIQGDFGQFYIEDDILGEGTTATVKKCIKRSTNDTYAVKIVHYRDDVEILTLVIMMYNNANHQDCQRVQEP